MCVCDVVGEILNSLSKLIDFVVTLKASFFSNVLNLTKPIQNTCKRLVIVLCGLKTATSLQVYYGVFSITKYRVYHVS